MKTDIFINAMRNRNNLLFLYSLKKVMIEPYYITKDRTGKKVIYGRINCTNEIRKFEYDKIANIKILKSLRFSPVIPILPKA